MTVYTPTTKKMIPGVKFVWPDEAILSDLIDNPNIKIGDDVIFRGPCIVYWGVEIGNKCQISHNVIIRENCSIGNYSKIGNGTTLDGYISIGENVSIHTLCFVSSKVNIEDHAFIGPGCIITNTPKIKHGRKYPLIEKPPYIKRAARIGGGTTILPAVTIGEDALIGAGSVVTKDIPGEHVAFGNPAKIIGPIPEDERFPNLNQEKTL